jgi:hypothetical protein
MLAVRQVHQADSAGWAVDLLLRFLPEVLKNRDHTEDTKARRKGGRQPEG